MAKHNKEAIIAKGIELIRKNGYHGTGVQQVLKACHIPKGSFYHFFESKQDFALQAIEKYASETVDTLKLILINKGLTGEQKLRRFFTDQLNFYKEQNYEMTCLMSIVSFEVGSVNPVLSKKISQKFDAIKALVAEIVKEGQEANEINRSLSAKQIADYLIDGFNGALITMKYEQSARGIEQFLTINLSFLKPD